MCFAKSMTTFHKHGSTNYYLYEFKLLISNIFKVLYLGQKMSNLFENINKSGKTLI